MLRYDGIAGAGAGRKYLKSWGWVRYQWMRHVQCCSGSIVEATFHIAPEAMMSNPDFCPRTASITADGLKKWVARACGDLEGTVLCVDAVALLLKRVSALARRVGRSLPSDVATM